MSWKWFNINLVSIYPKELNGLVVDVSVVASVVVVSVVVIIVVVVEVVLVLLALDLVVIFVVDVAVVVVAAVVAVVVVVVTVWENKKNVDLIFFISFILQLQHCNKTPSNISFRKFIVVNQFNTRVAGYIKWCHIENKLKVRMKIIAVTNSVNGDKKKFRMSKC